MKAYAEFHVPESYAEEFLPADLGKKKMNFVRIVRVPVGSEIYQKIGEIYKQVRTRDKKFFFHGWNIHRSYSKKELASAKLLLLKINKTFEPTGLECGTVYDNHNACDICGTGIQQITELILDLNTVPKNVDIARTISNEIIISREFAKLLIDNNVKGCNINIVHHNSPEYKKKAWFQLMATSLVSVNSATKTGEDPFDEDEHNKYRCAKGHTIGLDILSELSIDIDSWNGSDFAATKELFGVNRGLLRTYPLLVISQKLYRLITEMHCKGFTVEVVHLVARG